MTTKPVAMSSTRAPSLLLLDDRPEILELHVAHLQPFGYELATATTARQAVDLAARNFYDLLILDDQLDDRGGADALTGRDVLRLCRERDPDVGAIFVSAYNDPDRLIDVIRLGACDYLVKGRSGFPEQLAAAVERVLEQTQRQRLWRWFRSRLEMQPDPSSLVGESEAMRRVKDLIKRVAMQDDAPVLITGETGTGKELVAAEIHRLSPRHDQTYLPCNIASLEPSILSAELFGVERGAYTGADRSRLGYFQMANGGTLFLDEIGDLPLDCQPKLLRVLDQCEVQPVGETTARPVNVRVVAATNADLRRAVREHRFREDLWQRFVVEIRLPPLRDRGDDLERLTLHLVTSIAKRQNRKPPVIPPESVAALRHYHWPGNVRELKHTLERALMLYDGDVLTPDQLTFADDSSDVWTVDQLSGKDYETAAKEFEREYWLGVLRRYGGNKVRAAKHADVHRSTLYDRLKACGLDHTDPETP